MRTGKWCYGFNEEEFQGVFDTREEAINEAKDYIDDESTVFLGRIKEVDVRLPAWILLDKLGEIVYDQTGDYAAGYLSDVKQEHEDELDKELNKVLLSWMKKHGYEPWFYSVDDVEEVEVKSI